MIVSLMAHQVRFVVLTSSRYENCRCNDVHSSNASHKLRSSDDHSRAAEHIVDEVEEDEYNVSYVPIPNPDKFH